MHFVSTGYALCIQVIADLHMCYAVQFPTHQLGGCMELCVIRGYALSEVCVKRGLTVVSLARKLCHRAWPKNVGRKIFMLPMYICIQIFLPRFNF